MSHFQNNMYSSLAPHTHGIEIFLCISKLKSVAPTYRMMKNETYAINPYDFLLSMEHCFIIVLTLSCINT